MDFFSVKGEENYIVDTHCCQQLELNDSKSVKKKGNYDCVCQDWIIVEFKYANNLEDEQQKEEYSKNYVWLWDGGVDEEYRICNYVRDGHCKDDQIHAFSYQGEFLLEVVIFFLEILVFEFQWNSIINDFIRVNVIWIDNWINKN